MDLTMRWVGEGELDRVAETRMLCSGHARNDLARFKEVVRGDPREKPGDYLLAERGGKAVGTATSLSLDMWVRGGRFPCQGVAWVGTIKTERRRGSDRPGVATAVMRELLRKAREREQVLTALMPFRASFYQHFGYGTVERRCDWTIPLALLPTTNYQLSTDSRGIRFMEPADRPAIIDCWRRCTKRGQCEVERADHCWDPYFAAADMGYIFVDRPEDQGPVRGWALVQHIGIGAAGAGVRGGMISPEPRTLNPQAYLRVNDLVYDDVAALRRMLSFLGSLKDQHAVVAVQLPADLPLNLLLREPQIPHRPVVHSTAAVQSFTRMQLRALDHQRLIEGMQLAGTCKGSAVIGIHESEGHVSRLRLDIADGRATARPTEASPEIECADHTWAAVVTGELPAVMAAQLGLIQVASPRALSALDAFSMGPVPFCRDYF